MILIVEDSEPIATNIVLLCEEIGVQCLTAYTGAEALAVVAATALRLAVVDLRLPDVSGIALIGQIRALPAPHGDVPVLVETGDSRRAIEQAFVAGANGAIEKPYALATLKAAMVATMRTI